MTIEDQELYRELLAQIKADWQSLPDKPEETPETTLKTLWFLAYGLPRAIGCQTLGELPLLSEAEESALREYVSRRLEGIPLAHLTERQCFMELEFLASEAALIPRRETELLGYAALEKLYGLVEARGGVKVVDLCTGAGNLALALAHYEQNCVVYGCDLSAEAVALAEANAEYLQMMDMVQFLVGDLFAPLDAAGIGPVDLVTCNPPYISSGNLEKMPEEISAHEPQLAFDGGPFGVSLIMRLIKEAPEYLKPASWLCFEVGLGQGEAMLRRIQNNANYQTVESITNPAGAIRAILTQTR
ncbi:MAG: peptide chain release factor N(5)-glutamine methyltransferase [Anaerolineales bacterium]|nr:peptide chain release factor N(5)-glutamine methyltransferase [Anaerolineales bacterium]